MSKFKHRTPYSPTLKLNKIDNIPQNVDNLDPPSPIEPCSPYYNGEQWVWPSTSDTDYDNINIGRITPPIHTSTPQKVLPQNEEKSPDSIHIKSEPHSGDTTLEYIPELFPPSLNTSLNSTIVITSSPILDTQNSPTPNPILDTQNSLNSSSVNLSESIQVIPETQDILNKSDSVHDVQILDETEDNILQQLKSDRNSRKRHFNFALTGNNIYTSKYLVQNIKYQCKTKHFYQI